MAIEILCSINSSSAAQVCLRYWAREPDGRWRESLDTLCESLDLTPKRLQEAVLASSVAYVLGVRCSICGSPEVVQTRSDFDEVVRSAKAPYGACKRATCQLAVRPLDAKAAAATLAERVDFVTDALQRLGREMQRVDYSNLNFAEAFYLYCVVAGAGADRSLAENELPAIDSYRIPLAPTRLLADLAYTRLRRAGVLVPSVHSSLSAFNLTSPVGSPITFDVRRVRWTMAKPYIGSSQIELLDALQSQMMRAEIGSRAELRRTLIEHECVNDVVAALGSAEVALDTPFEMQLLSAVRHCLNVVPVRSMAVVIGHVFLDNNFRKALRRAGREGKATVVAEALTAFVDQRHFGKTTPNVLSSVADSKLEVSSCLMSQRFYHLFLE